MISKVSFCTKVLCPVVAQCLYGTLLGCEESGEGKGSERKGREGDRQDGGEGRRRAEKRGAKGQIGADLPFWDLCHPIHFDSGYDELMLGEFWRLSILS